LIIQVAEINSLENKDFQAVNLPYRNRFMATVILPNQGVSVSSTLEYLAKEDWGKFQGRFKSQKVNLSLPRFKIEWKKKFGEGFGIYGNV